MTSRRDSRGPDYEDDERFAEWVDGCMSERDRDRFEAEMRVNPRLREAAERYRRTVESVRTVLRAEGPKIDVADAVLARIAGRTAAPAAAPDPAPARGPTRASHGSPFRWRALLASVSVAAALVALFVWLDRIEPAIRSDEVVAAPEAARAANEEPELLRLDQPAAEGQWQADGAGSARESERSKQRPERQQLEAETAEDKAARILALEHLAEERAGQAPASEPTEPTEPTEQSKEETKGASSRLGASERSGPPSPKVAAPGSAKPAEADRAAPLPSAATPAGPATPGPAGPATGGLGGPPSRGAPGSTAGRPQPDTRLDEPRPEQPNFGARGSRGNGDPGEPGARGARHRETATGTRAEQRDADTPAGESGIASTLPLLTFAPQAGGGPEANQGSRDRAGESAAAETKRRSQPGLRMLALLEPATDPATTAATGPGAGEAADDALRSRAQETGSAPPPRVRRLQADATAIRTIAPGMFAWSPGDAFLIEGDEAQVKALLGRLAATAQRERFAMQTAEIPLGLVEALTPALPADAEVGPGGRADEFRKAGESRQAGQGGDRQAGLADDPGQPGPTGGAGRERSREDDARRRDARAAAEPPAPGKDGAPVRVVVVLRDTPLPPPAAEADKGR